MDEPRVLNRQTFYGSESKNICAYCYKHRKAMTPKQLKQRECLKRQCGAFKKIEDHPIWKSKEKSKALRKARKNRLEKMYQEIKGGSAK